MHTLFLADQHPILLSGTDIRRVFFHTCDSVIHGKILQSDCSNLPSRVSPLLQFCRLRFSSFIFGILNSNYVVSNTIRGIRQEIAFSKLPASDLNARRHRLIHYHSNMHQRDSSNRESPPTCPPESRLFPLESLL